MTPSMGNIPGLAQWSFVCQGMSLDGIEAQSGFVHSSP
jgi:hypothetical protein